METKNLNIAISKIEIKSFSMSNESVRFQFDKKVLVGLNIDFHTPSADNIFKFTLDINVSTDEPDSKKLANLKIDNSFFVHNAQDFLVPSKKEGVGTEISSGLVAFCLEASMGHARGIWAAKTESTPLEPLALPLIPAPTLMKHMTPISKDNIGS